MNRTEELEKELIRISKLSEDAMLDSCIVAVLQLKEEYLESNRSKYDNRQEFTAILHTYNTVLKKLESLKTSREQK